MSVEHVLQRVVAGRFLKLVLLLIDPEMQRERERERENSSAC